MVKPSPAEAIGIDLGGTKIEIARVDGAGTIRDRVHVPTGPAGDPEHTVREISACLTGKFLDTGTRPPVGIGVAGQVDPASGLVHFAPNLQWRDFPLRERLEESLATSVTVMNDVHAAAYGEWKYGAGRGCRDMVCLFVGTGIGGGVVAGGNFLTGASGSAGELGHITIDREGPLCSCGNRGCLEAFSGGWAIAERARRHLTAAPEAGEWLRRLAGGDVAAVTAETVSQACRKGDALALRLKEETVRALGVGVATIVNAFNPELVILGGGVVEGFPDIAELVEREARQRALKAPLQHFRIAAAALGGSAGAIGAAARARDLFD